MSRSIYDVQRDIAISSSLQSHIIWDSYAPEDSEILFLKIKTLFPDGDAKNRKEIERTRKILFENVWAQRKYTNGALLATIVYIMVTNEKNVENAKNSRRYTIHPVFRTRKCLNSGNSLDCCMIFIDETGRVYGNWKHFIETNVLPKGTMVAPANGIYKLDENDQVLLECQQTPAARPKSLILNATDRVAGISSLVATLPIATALAMPVAAPIMAGATAVCLSTSLYTAIRSAQNLRDRDLHSQAIALTDAEARREWLGVATGAVGIGASGATKALNYVAASREISLGAKIAVNSINVSSILLSGSGIIVNVYDIYTKINNDEKINSMDILHLASSLLVFTHSVNNLKIALKVSNKNGSRVSLRSALSEQMRSTFNRIASENVTLRGRVDARSTFDITRTLNDIPRNDVLQNLHALNTNLRIHDILLNCAANAIETTNVWPSQLNLIWRFACGDRNIDIINLVEVLGTKFTHHIVNQSSLREVINALFKYFQMKTISLLLNFTRTFLEVFANEIERKLCTFVSTETVLYKILMHCIKQYSKFDCKYLESKTGEIFTAVKEYFDSLTPYCDDVTENVCKTCNGYFMVHPLSS